MITVFFDDFNRDAIDMEIDFLLLSERVIQELKQIISWRVKPEVIRCDSGPEYISMALQTWAQEMGSGLNTFNLGTHNKTHMWKGSIGRCGTSGCRSTVGMTWQKCKTFRRSGCGLTTTIAIYGLRRVHTLKAAVHGCITFLLLRLMQKERITQLSLI